MVDRIDEDEDEDEYEYEYEDDEEHVLAQPIFCGIGSGRSSHRVPSFLRGTPFFHRTSKSKLMPSLSLTSGFVECFPEKLHPPPSNPTASRGLDCRTLLDCSFICPMIIVQVFTLRFIQGGGGFAFKRKAT